MTVTIEQSFVIAEGDDSSTRFPFPFQLGDSGDLVVALITDYQTENAVVTVLTEGVDYTSIGGSAENTGEVQYPLSGDPLASTDALSIYRTTPVVQSTDITNGARFYPEVHEGVWDLLVLMIQENRDSISVLETRVDNISDEIDNLPPPGGDVCCPPVTGYDEPYVSNTDRASWDAGGQDAHTHSNKTVLDTITQPGVDAWDATAAIVTDQGDGTKSLRDDGTYKVDTGGGGGEGILAPTGPVRVNDIVTYAATDGTQGGETPTEVYLGDMRAYTDASGTWHIEAIAGGSANLVLHAGGLALELNAPAAGPMAVNAIGAPLAIDSDTPFPTNGDGRLNAVSIDGFRMPPGAEAVVGTSVQISNTLDTEGNPTVGVFDVNSAENPGGVFGSTVTGI